MISHGCVMKNTLFFALSMLTLAGICFAEVIFTENFEEETLDAVAERWDTVVNLEGMSLTDDVPPESGGSRSLVGTLNATRILMWVIR